MTQKLFKVVVVMAMATLSLSQIPPQGPPMPGPMPPQGGGYQQPPPAANNYPQVQSSHCRYLINAPSPWGTNAAPFKLYTRSYAGEIRRGNPVEVSLLPFYEAFKHFTFTDFALWAEPVSMRPQQPMEPEMQWGGGAPQSIPPPPGTVTHLGVWQVFPQYAGGAGSMKCNMYTQGEDTVGSFEERMLELLQTQFPGDAKLANFQPSSRHGAAFLWYPDERTMRTAGAIKFVAKLKSFGQWFKLESSPWRVYAPPPPRPVMNYGMGTGNGMENFNLFVENFATMAGQAKQMERRLDRLGTPGI